ncbi:MAG TPA: hypothetical protein VHZ95_18830 [Polyangiales bacterium]|nr:hypothetical protein [Polyangiales bacterium]
MRKALEYARQQGEAAAAPSPSTPRNASKLGRTGDALLLEAKQQRVERCRQLASDINQHLDHGEDFDDPDQSRRLRRLSWLLGDDRALEFVELLREGDVSEVAL